MTGGVADGEQDAGPEGVLQPPPPVDEAEAGALGDLLLQPQSQTEGVPLVGRPSQPEAAHHLALVTPAAKVVTGHTGVGSRQQTLVVPLGGLLHGVEEDLAPLAVVAGCGILVDGDAGLVGQATDGVHEIEVLDGPYEADGVALGMAAEAVVEALLGVDTERGCLLPVKRTQAHPSAALTFERSLLPDEGHDVRGRPDPGDVLVGNPHGRRRYRVGEVGRPAQATGAPLLPWPSSPT